MAVLTTRMLLEQQSDTKLAQKPMNAARERRITFCVAASYCGSDASSVLFCGCLVVLLLCGVFVCVVCV